MRHICIYILFFISLFSNITISRAADQTMLIKETINITKGLSNNSVNTIFQDSRGYIWIGTYDGLCCYNGFSITTYKNKELPSSTINSIVEDSQGRLWIGTDNGAAVYDYQRDIFTALSSEEVKRTRSNLSIVKIIISSDNNNAICITKHDGVVVYDLALNFLQSTGSVVQPTYDDAIELDDNSILIVTPKGLIHYRVEENSSQRHFDNFESVWPRCIYKAKDSIIIGTSNGLYSVDTKLDRSGKESFSCKKLNLLKGYQINTIKEDSNGKAWILSPNVGLLYLDELTTKSKHFSVKNRYVSFKSTDLLVLSDESVMVSTEHKGIYNLSNMESSFDCWQSSEIESPQIVAIDSTQFLIVAANQNFKLYNTSTKTVEPIEIESDSRHTPYIFGDSKGGLLGFQSDGIYRYYLHEDKLTTKQIFENRPRIIKGIAPNTACQDDDGNLWLGYSNNIYRIKFDKNDSLVNIESINNNPILNKIAISNVNSLFYDQQCNSMWIGTTLHGLMRINLNDSSPLAEVEVEQYTHSSEDLYSITSNNVSSITRHSNGDLWISTEHGGICRVDELEDTLIFISISEKEGLSSSVIKNIISGNDKNLWFATSNGISSYDIEKNLIRNFGSEDGISISNFANNFATNSNGIIGFTNTDGICFFNPLKIPKDKSTPKLQFRGFSIFNDYIQPEVEYNGRVVLNHRLQNGDAISLKYIENTISFNVDILCQSDSYGQYINYRMAPISDEWITIPASQQNISFNGLRPDKYSLEVYGSNAMGKTTDIQTIDIFIKPPFWRTTTAYILYAIIIIGLIYISLYVWLKLQQYKLSVILEQQKQEHLEALNIEKQQYFSNIVHEIKTPLSLIIAPLAQLTDDFKFEVRIKERLEIINNQALKMINLIDLSNAVQSDEVDLLKVREEEFSMSESIESMSADFKFMGDYYHKEFKVNYPNHEIKVNGDSELIEKALFNLLNNAFKHTEEGDSIELSYFADNTNLIIEVEDSGCGISQDDLPHIFERFYKGKTKSKAWGTGIGLAFTKSIIEKHNGTISAESQLGVKTIFTISLPIIISVNELITKPQNIESAAHEMIIGDVEVIRDDFETQFRESMIYIVDDNIEMRSLLVDIIGRHYHTKCFANGKECLDEMSNEWPDIVVSDVMMPEISGDQMCEVIKSDIKTCHIPVILITACNTIDDKIRGLEYGADSYINKPFYPKHIITQIEMLLKNRQVLKERFQASIPLTQGKSKGFSAKDNEFIEKLYKLFEENICNDEIDMAELATQLAMNRSTFFAKVKALLGEPPFELLKNYRLQVAAELLQSGEYNVSEACMMTGFKSRSHFSYQFKNKFNVSPSKYLDSSKAL